MREVRYVGPLSTHEIVVDGWSVPLLHAHPSGEHDESVLLVIDNRLAATFSVAEAERVVPFVADAIAVALGYTAHPNADSPEPLLKLPQPHPVRTHSAALEQREIKNSVRGAHHNVSAKYLPNYLDEYVLRWNYRKAGAGVIFWEILDRARKAPLAAS